MIVRVAAEGCDLTEHRQHALQRARTARDGDLELLRVAEVSFEELHLLAELGGPDRTERRPVDEEQILRGRAVVPGDHLLALDPDDLEREPPRGRDGVGQQIAGIGREPYQRRV